MYLDKSCSTSRLLSQGDGRGTQWGRSPAGSPGGHPDRCTGCRAGVRRSGRPGATPPRGSMSSHHAHRLGQGRQEGRRVSTLGLGQSPIVVRVGPWGVPASPVWPSHTACRGQGINQSPVPDIPHLSTQGRGGTGKFLLKMKSPPCLSWAPMMKCGEGWPDGRRPVLSIPGHASVGRSRVFSQPQCPICQRGAGRMPLWLLPLHQSG